MTSFVTCNSYVPSINFQYNLRVIDTNKFQICVGFCTDATENPNELQTQSKRGVPHLIQIQILQQHHMYNAYMHAVHHMAHTNLQTIHANSNLHQLLPTSSLILLLLLEPKRESFSSKPFQLLDLILIISQVLELFIPDAFHSAIWRITFLHGRAYICSVHAPGGAFVPDIFRLSAVPLMISLS